MILALNEPMPPSHPMAQRSSAASFLVWYEMPPCPGRSIAGLLKWIADNPSRTDIKPYQSMIIELARAWGWPSK